MLRNTPSSRVAMSRFVYYAPSLAALQLHARLFNTTKKCAASGGRGGDGDANNADAPKCETEQRTNATDEKVSNENITAASKVPLPSTTNSRNLIWPSCVLGPLTKIDRRFQLPGSVGLADEYLFGSTKSEIGVTSQNPALRSAGSSGEAAKQFGSSIEFRTFRDINDELIALSNEDQRARTMEQVSEALEADGESVARTRLLECVAHDCPRLLRYDFQPLFTNRNLHAEDNLTVVTLTQKTNADMTTWSQIVAQERELLLDTFVATAESVCARLRESGFWADFIDPASGQPFYGAARSSDALFETDERLSRLGGFEIDELTCCKVVRHHRFGTHAYIGCLFTNASHSDPYLRELLTCVNVPGADAPTQGQSCTQLNANETSTNGSS